MHAQARSLFRPCALAISLLVSIWNVPLIQAQASEKVAELQNIDAEIVILQSQVEEKTNQLEKLEKNKKVTEAELKQLRAQTMTLEQQTQAAAAELVEIQRRLQELVQRDAQTRQRMLQVIRRVYMLTPPSQPPGSVSSLIGGTGQESLVRTTFYLSKVRGFDSSQLKLFAGQKVDLERTRGERTALLEKQAVLRAQVSSKIKAVQFKNDELKRAVAGILTNKRELQQSLKGVKAQRLRFETVLASLSEEPSSLSDAKARQMGGTLSDAAGETLSGLSRDTTIAPVEADVVVPFGKVKEPSPFGIVYKGEVERPVVALASGVVTHVARLGRFGFLVLIDHGERYFSLYSQLAAVDVKVQQVVSRGQQLGTANSRGLYLEIRKEGKAIDPQRFLKSR